ncbi:hypothetical protein DXG03_009647 [Asterophora parasitica]|uniref:Uncharacterized protein n=1 Tax=Asterophora parasitica TaxID=117018 RepID=A0A9P7KAU3_9AGAR|nr:hypothetical protein DXG03_009647 [Asterophora parasitica]
MHTSTHEDDSDDADDYSFSSSYPSFTKGQEDLLDCLVYRVEDAEDEGVDSSDDDDSWELYVECMDEVDLGDFEDNHIVEEEDDEYGVFVDKLPCAFCDSPPQATITTPYYGHTFCAPWHSTFKTHVHSVTRVDL